MWWEAVCAVIGLLLALYGAVDLLLRCVYRLVFGKGEEHVVCPVRDELRLRRLAMWQQWAPSGGIRPTVLLCESDRQTRRLCEELGLCVLTQKEWDEMCKSALQVEESTL